MKIFFLFLVAVTGLCIGCKNNKTDAKKDELTTKNNTLSKKGWSEDDRNDFKKDMCHTGSGSNQKEDPPELCSCMLSAAEKYFTSYKETMEFMKSDKFANSDFIKEAHECNDKYALKNNGDTKDNNNQTNKGWSSSDKNKWFDICAEYKFSNQVCSCGLERAEAQFSSYEEADEASHSENIKNIMVDCKTKFAQ